MASGTYYFCFFMLLAAAFCTAAYMMRTIWYAFYNGKFKGNTHGHGEPHESGPRMAVPLIILATLAVIAGFANFPWGPAAIKDRFEKLVEPVGGFFPSAANHFVNADFSFWLAGIALLVGLSGLGFVYLYYWKGMFAPLHDLTERSRIARVGKTILVNKYYLDWLYTDVIVGFVKGPLARATNWVNQNVIDGVVNGAGTTAVKVGQYVYDNIDQAGIDGAVNGAAMVANESGTGLRKMQTGRIQQYAALLFAATAILAGIFVLVIR
jgi:NADH-quinone oxidoreductase subunit L